jgi:flagellar hook assembly protein FlgD
VCSDALSDLAAGACPVPATLAGEGAGQSATGTVVDKAGNSASTTVSDINIDLTAPAVTLTPDRAANAAGWYNAPVTFVVSSPGSDLSGGVTCDASIVYSGPDSATASVTGHCADAAGNVGSGSASFKYDATAPTITISSPVNGAQHVLNAAVPSGYGCSDTISGIQSCTGTVANGLNFDTSSVGPHSFTVTATDRAGNSATPVRVTYNVIYSQSKGRTVLSPLEQVGNPSNLKKSSQTGSTIPIKFQLFDSKGVPIGTAKPTLQIFDANGKLVPVKASGSSNVDNVFRYDPTEQQYIYNLSTKGLSPGVYRILITLGDGSPPIVTYFQLK